MVVCLLGCSSVCEIDGGWSHTGPLQVLPSWMKSIVSTMLWKYPGVLPFTFSSAVLRTLCLCFHCGKNQTTNQLPWVDEVNVDVMLAGE
jgi:hypothetical protein